MLLREVTKHSDAGHDDNTKNKISKLPYTIPYYLAYNPVNVKQIMTT